jgi:uncharacterized protein involved in type VI secretion and phage assembly
VIGCVYNNNLQAPDAASISPTKSLFQTNSSRKANCYNELSIDDAAGSEMIYLKAAKDMALDIAGDYNTIFKKF